MMNKIRKKILFLPLSIFFFYSCSTVNEVSSTINEAAATSYESLKEGVVLMKSSVISGYGNAKSKVLGE